MAIDVKKMYTRYGPMVNRRCQSLLGDKEEAADAMHDVFVQLVRRRDKLRPVAAPALLYRIATYVCLNRMRSLRRHPETPGDKLLQFIASSDEIDKLVEHRSLLGQIFKREEPSTRVIAVLHYVDRMTLKEVARVVGMSVSGVRKRLRTLKKHARELQEMSR
ncbi:MAG: sigma-70 family RNA polymerase sigma factor [Deltaproteobacteria bacterium]|nr:sigma-70 family RNA polymerase sigma factor [Deltaproteobacteria bacterium]